MNAQQRVALVTGASRGIGRAVAEALAAQGLIVIGTATTESGAAAITERLKALGNAGAGMALDVSQPEQVEQVVERITTEYGIPLVLVNNAGITRDNLLMRMKTEEWDAVIETNLNAVFRVTKACLRGMTKARWGRIVSISSVVGAMGNAGQANYAASKAGVAGFSRALAAEIGGRGVTVNVVAPGFIDTDMTRDLPEAQKEALQQRIALGRLGLPEEIASTVAFLVSDGAAYITGETIHVNGGMYMA